MIGRTLHATTLAACSALTLTLAAAIALADPPGTTAPQLAAPTAAPPANAPLSSAPPTPPASAAPIPQPALLIPQGPLIQHRERGNLVFEGIPPPDPALATRLARYQQSRGATFLDWLADGSLLVSTRFGDTEQVHRVNAPLGMREQLTFYSDPIEWARGAKSGKGFVFLKDHAGDDNAQVYYHSGVGEARALTHGNFIHGSTVWAHDGKRVAFYGNDRDSLSYDVYVADVTGSGVPQLVVGGRDDTWYPLDWSPDDSKLLVWKYLSSSESYLYVADVASGAVTPLEQKPARAGIRMARFDPAGRGVYVVTDEDGEFAQLKFKDLFTHESRRISPDVNWDVEDFDVSADGRYIAYVLNEDGRSRLAHLAARCVGVRGREGHCDALDAQRGGGGRCQQLRRARARALPDLGPRGRSRAAPVRVRLPPSAGERPGAGGDRHSRRPRSAVPPRVGSVRAVPRQRARLRRGRAQRARLIG